MIVETIISYGFHDLLETFFRANDLKVAITARYKEDYPTLSTLEYDDNSETAHSITFMSYRHMGLENMLIDYIFRLGYSKQHISTGRTIVKRDMKALDNAWEERRKELGFR